MSYIRDARQQVAFGTSAGAAAGAAAGTVIPVVGTAAGSVIGGLISSVFKQSAAGPNTEAAKAVLPLALAGNLAAVKAIAKRATYIATETSAAPWKAALIAVQQVHPEWVTAALNAPGIPEEWVMGVDPTQVLPLVQRYAVYATTNPATGVVSTSTTPTNTQHAALATASMGGWVGGVILAGVAVGFLVKRPRGRRARR